CFTLIFLPHLISDNWLSKSTYKITLLDKLSKWKPENNKWLLVFIFLISPLLWYYAKDTKFDSDLMNMNYMSPSLKKSEATISKDIDFTLGNVFIINKSGNLDQINKTDKLIQHTIDSLEQHNLIRYGI